MYAGDTSCRRSFVCVTWFDPSSEALTAHFLGFGLVELDDQSKADEKLMSNPSAKDSILGMESLFTLFGAYTVIDKMCRG